MKVSIHSLEKTLYEGQANVLSLPTAMGEISVLNHHIPLITSLVKGEIKIKNQNEKEGLKFSIDSGFAEVSDQKITILVK